jgi:hypothetical protein
MERSAEEARKYAADRENESPLDLKKCSLCGRVGQEMKEYGQPLGYLACIDLADCEKIRERKSR